jgi:hypothetical protein
MGDENCIVHLSPYSDWYADQDVSRGVSFYDKATGRKVTVEPPAEWGRNWSWNVTEDGKGIYFRRNLCQFRQRFNFALSVEHEIGEAFGGENDGQITRNPAQLRITKRKGEMPMTPPSRQLEPRDFPSQVRAVAEGLENVLLVLRQRQSGQNGAGDSQLIVRSLQLIADRLTGLGKVVAELRDLFIGQQQEKEWYSTGELAEILGKSQYTVQERWCNDGRVDCEKDPTTGKWRIPGHEVCRLKAGGGLLPRHGDRAGKV